MSPDSKKARRPILLSSRISVFEHRKGNIAEGDHKRWSPSSRLRNDLANHFSEDQSRYLRGSQLSSISVKGTLEKAVAYAFRGLFSAGATMMILSWCFLES
jgi:hypothetical protein